jgi:hypothetical protein
MTPLQMLTVSISLEIWQDVLYIIMSSFVGWYIEHTISHMCLIACISCWISGFVFFKEPKVITMLICEAT